MLSKVHSGAVYGVDAYPVEIEVNTGWGDPQTVIVGLRMPPSRIQREQHCVMSNQQ